jgi:hypothetical protein
VVVDGDRLARRQVLAQVRGWLSAIAQVKPIDTEVKDGAIRLAKGERVHFGSARTVRGNDNAGGLKRGGRGAAGAQAQSGTYRGSDD